MLRTLRGGKGLGGFGGGLGSRNRSGPGAPPTPGLRGQGTSPGSPAGFLGSSGQGKCPPLLSCSSGLGSGRAPPACLSSSPLPPSYAPRTSVVWGGGPWMAGDRPGSSAGSSLFFCFSVFCFEQPRTAFINPHFQHRFILNFEMCLFYMNMGMRKR